MPTPREKFQELLKKLFQFDCAELDFGIYRIMNQKRAVIERFIEKDLLDGVAKELSSGALARESRLVEEFADVTAQIKGVLGEEALDPEGNLDPQYHYTTIGKQYLELRERVGKAKSSPELEAEIFNHLYTFFSRYYDDGDFMSLRRYSKRDKYAIPYNGEEVHLHWANSDQYYIKTGENFTDYSYKHEGWSVRFKLRNADVEQNNVKGAKRFFIPRCDELAFDDAAKTVTLPFEFRPLEADEAIRYGKGSKGEGENGAAGNRNGKEKGKRKRGQDGILADALVALTEAAKKHPSALAALMTAKRKDADGNPVSLIEHHLRAYTRANTSDFFIHKDLKGFLERELDFYLKNEVLNLDELEAGGEARSESWFQLLRTIKAIGRKIIAFVAQIENFQKRLFEKKKFVTEVQYCLTLGRVPEELYPEIAKNKAQIAEWKRLFHVQDIKGDLATPGFKEPVKMEFLKAHPTLVVDTRHFSSEFTARLLSAIPDLDVMIDGLLIQSENSQAISLLKARYREQVKCIYIDPPYNTGNDGFVYKDNYQHSSWLAMIAHTSSCARSFLQPGSSFFASCDDNENARLRECLDSTFGAQNFEAQIIVQSNKRGQTYKSIAKTHEYLLVYDGDETTELGGLPREIEDGEQDEYGRYELWELRNRNPKFGRFNRPNLFFPIYVSESDYERDAYSCVSVEPTAEFAVPVYPRNSYGADSCWRWSITKVGAAAQARNQILIAKRLRSGEWRIWEKSRKSVKAPKSIWVGSDVINEKGTIQVGALGLKNFGFPKPLGLLETVIQIGMSQGDLVFDYFAGTGTTGHAVINKNREDDGQRKLMLVEMGDHFDSVLLPRLKKVTFAPEWKDGKPARMATSEEAERSPRIMKILRLESYEDALDNITFQTNEQAMLELEDYVLSYMLDFETKQSDTLLNVAKLDAPLDYKLRRHGKDEPLPVDLPETFNYLIGLHVASRRVYENKGARYLVYRGRAEGRETAILWRTTRGWGQKELEADKDFVEKHKLTQGAEDVFVNSDSFIPGARSLDPVFKRRMFNEE
jgi:adenine-specific DNA-methyltransferase